MRIARRKLLNIYATQMEMLQFRSDYGESKFSRRKFVTRRAAELLKALRLIDLVRGSLFLRHLDDNGHRSQHIYASLKAFGPLLTCLGVTEFAVATHGVAALASLSIKDVCRKFLWAFAGRDHAIQGAAIRRGGLGLSAHFGENGQHQRDSRESGSPPSCPANQNQT